MINQSANEFDRARIRMASDLKTMIIDSEDLLKAVASVSGESFAATRTRFEEKLRNAKATLADSTKPILDRTKETAVATDEYVHHNAWGVAAAALVAGVLIGFLTSRR